MRVVPFSDEALKELDVVALALGYFDALHTGHKRVLKTALKYGRKKSALVTFNKNPKYYLEGKNFKPILTFNQKCKILEKMGFNTLIVIDFSSEFSKMSGEGFVNRLLQISSLRYLIAGADFQCGHNRAANIETIKAILKNQRVVLKTVSIGCKRACKVSSSLVRNLVLSGQFRNVKALTRRDYILKLPSNLSKPTRLGSKFQWQFPYNLLNQLFPTSGTYLASYKKEGLLISVSKGIVSLTFKNEILPPWVIVKKQIYKGDQK